MTFKTEKFNVGGDGAFDYLTAEAGTGRIFLSRGTHVQVIDGATGKVLGDITGLMGVHGIGVATKENHGFITHMGGVTMFDLKTFAVIKEIPVSQGGLDGIMYDDGTNKIILTNHSRPVGTVVAIDAKTGDIAGAVDLEDNAPEGAASDGKGKIFVNLEGKSAIQVIDLKTMKASPSWPLAPCDGPTGIAYDRATDRIISGCSGTSVVLDAKTGKVVANITNGQGVDALGFDPTTKLAYIPSGSGAGSVTVVHEDSPDKYTVVGTVATQAGARTIAVDPVTHNAYVFSPEYGPAPAPAAGATPPPAGRAGRGARGPMIGAWLVVIHKP